MFAKVGVQAESDGFGLCLLVKVGQIYWKDERGLTSNIYIMYINSPRSVKEHHVISKNRLEQMKQFGPIKTINQL